ncbi:MAG: hypothetical protein ABIQ47_10775, partial [Tepidiformaceae bacterium]
TLIFFNKEAVAVVAASNPTITKTQEATPISGDRARWTITISNSQTGNALLDDFVINDTGARLDSISGTPSPSGVPCGVLPNTNVPFACDVAANSVLVLHVSKPLSLATNANNTCLPGTIDNSATASTGGASPVAVTVTAMSTSITVPATAAPSCNNGTIIIEKIYLPTGVTPVVPALFIGEAAAVVGSNSTSSGDHSVSETPPPGWKFVGVAATEGCDEVQPLFSEDFALHRAFQALSGTNEIAVFVSPGVTCTVTFTNELQTGKLFVKKLKDPTANQLVDGSQFNGTIGSQTWGPVGFNGTTPEIIVPAGSHAFAETGSQNGWTPVGYAILTNWNSDTACPAGKASYTSGLVPVVANQVTLVCVMNTKTALVVAPTIKKVKVDATHYTITVHNGGSTPITNIAVTDTFSQGGTAQKIDVVTWNPNDGLCSFGPNKLSFACTGLTVPAGGNLVINVFMTPYTNAQVCSDQIVTNTVRATSDTQGEITITPGFSNVATHTFPTARTDCTNGTIAVKKVRDPGASSAADGTPFGGTIDGASWSGFITFGGVTTPKSVNAGSHSVAETAPGGGWVLVGYQVFTNSSTTATCSTDLRSYSKSALNEVTGAVTTGQLTLVCVMNTKASPPPITQDCTTCAPLIVSTPTPTPTPTPTAPAATPVNTSTATNTPIPPTATKTTVDAVAGEKTPGPAAKSTPIAPSTGGGISGSGSSLTGVLAFIGIAILGAGMALMAAGRRRKQG